MNVNYASMLTSPCLHNQTVEESEVWNTFCWYWPFPSSTSFVAWGLTQACRYGRTNENAIQLLWNLVHYIFFFNLINNLNFYYNALTVLTSSDMNSLNCKTMLEWNSHNCYTNFRQILCANMQILLILGIIHCFWNIFLSFKSYFVIVSVHMSSRCASLLSVYFHCLELLKIIIIDMIISDF